MSARFCVEQTDGEPGAFVEVSLGVLVWVSLQPPTAHAHSGRGLGFLVT